MPDNTAARPRHWTLRCLGAATLACSDGEEPLPLARKDAALLAYVGLHEVVPSARLAALLWPAADERGALNSMRQRLFRLRKSTAARLIEVDSRTRLAADLLVPGVGDIDRLEDDSHAWDGEFLGAFDYADCTELDAWVVTQRRHWVALRREALSGIASRAEQQHEIARALVYARRLLHDDPLSEHAHRRVMRLHYQRGDTAAAVAAFEACEATLKDELGLPPSAETLALLGTIERGRPPDASAEARPAPVPAALLRPPRAVGRHAERAQLAQAHADGRIVAIVGEAGMGKTRLLLDFIAAQSRAVYAQARPGDAAVPYGVLARLLRVLLAAAPDALAQAPRSELARVAPEWGEGAMPPAGSTQAPRLQAAIEQVMVNALAAGVTTLVVDDLHFADPASVEMLRALVDADALIGMRWSFAHRPVGATDDNGALLQALADSPRACWITLAPLTDDDLVELLDSLSLPGIGAAEFAPALARHTGGNPLYVLETLREARLQPVSTGAAAHAALPRPQSIAHMIDRRLQRLSEPALSLARVAALAGADFSPELAEHALGAPVLALASAWAELEAADVLRGSAFAHDLIRDGMLRATPAVIAVHAHNALAEYLERSGGEPARVAQHWEDAGNASRAANAWVMAADRARAAMRIGEELELLQRAMVSLASGLDSARRAALSSRIGRLLLTVGNIAAARATATDALGAARTDAERIHALGLLMEVHSLALEFPESLAVAHRLIQCAQGCGDAAAELHGWRGVAAAHGNEGRIEEALAVHESHADWVDAQVVTEDVLEWSNDHAYMLDRLGRQDESVNLYAQVAKRAVAHGHGRVAYEALTNQVMSTYRLGLTADALALANRIAPLAGDSPGAPQIDPVHQSVVGGVSRDLGQYTDAIRLLESAIAASRAQQADHWVPGMLCTLALAYAQLGQHHRVGQLFAQLDAPVDAPAHAYNVMSRSHAARYDPACTNSAQAAHRDALRDALSMHLPDRYRMWLLLELAAWLCDNGDGQEAEDALVLAGRVGGPGFVLHARVRLLPWLQSRGEARRAIAEAKVVAEALARRDAHGIYRPEALLVCAGSLNTGCELANKLLADAKRWVERAADHVPASFLESFRQRNVFNSRLI